MDVRIAVLDPAAERFDPARLTFALAAFHTAFNVLNTAILIGFIPQIEKTGDYVMNVVESRLDAGKSIPYLLPEAEILQ